MKKIIVSFALLQSACTPLQNPEFKLARATGQAHLGPESQSQTIETNLLPIKMTTDFIATRSPIYLGAGGIATVHEKILILDRLGQFFVYDKGSLNSAAFPRLPMNVDSYRKQAPFPLDESTLRTHDLKFHFQSGFLFASFEVYDQESQSTHLEVGRIQVDPDKIIGIGQWEKIFETPPLSHLSIIKEGLGTYSGRGAGGKLAFRGDSLFIAIGDYNLEGPGLPKSQDAKSFLGKTYEIDLKSKQMKVLSFGHRVPLGLGVDHQGRLWLTENAARGGDKLIQIQNGQNHGWPFHILGTFYFKYIGSQSKTPFADPFFAWVPSIAPTAVVQVGNFDHRWDGDFLIGSLKAQTLFRLRILNDRVLYSEPIWIGHRIRDIAVAKEQILLWTDDGTIVSLSPDKEVLESNNLNRHRVYGKPIFARCVSCHSFEDQNRNYWAPSLKGVYGRKIGGDAFQNYSNALKNRKGTWDKSSLLAFIMSPSGFIPGTSMPGVQLTLDDARKITEELAAESKK